MHKWTVYVVEHETEKVVRTIPCRSEQDAEKAERGVIRQMDGERFYTHIMGPDDYDPSDDAVQTAGGWQVI